MQGITAAFVVRAAAVACIAASANVQAESEIWRNDWFLSSPPTFARAFVDSPKARTAFAANGDILFGGISYSQTEYQFVRLAADGSVRWSANIGYNLLLGQFGPNALIATADGGALVAFGYSYYGLPDYVARIDAAGTFAWLREVPALALAEGGTDRLVAGCSGALTVFDRQSGGVIWQKMGVSSCPLSAGLAVDDVGNIYTLAWEADEYRIQKYDADGLLVWNLASGADIYASVDIAGVSNGLVYVRAVDELLAFHASDGSAAWSTDIGYNSVLLAGSPAEPIVFGQDSIRRLAEDSGLARWTVSLTNNGIVEPVGDALLVGKPSYAFARVDLASGGIVWTKTLPAQDTFGHSLQYFRLGGLQSGSFSAVARPITYRPAPPVVERVAFADGAVAGMLDLPAIPQGPSGSSVADGADRVLGVQSAWSEHAPTVRVRSLDAVDGSVRWEQSVALDLDVFDPDIPIQVSAQISSAGSSAAVAAACSFSGSIDPGLGALWLGLYDGDSGNPLWQKVIRDADQGATSISAPMADSLGDIYIDVGAAVPCEFGGHGCGRQTLLKVSKDDGHVLWRFSNDITTGSNYVYSQPFVVAGTDAIVSGPFAGALSSASLISLAGSDGTMRWTSELFGPGGVEVLPAEDGIFVIGSGWAKLDLVTGSALWVGPVFTPSCSIACYSYESVLLPNDDIVVVGEADNQPLVTLLRGDGSGEYQNWRLEPNSPTVRSATTLVRRDSSGRTWLGLLRANRGGIGGLYVLAEFDPETGELLSQQVLRDRVGDPLDRIVLAGMIGAPESNRLLLDERTSGPPAATPSGNVLLDTSITARGDLGIALDVDRPHVQPQQLIGFHARLTYAGDAPIAGAHLNIYLPWSSGVRDVTCTGTEGCTTDTTSGNVRATVDLSSGAVVDVTGQVLALNTGYEETSALTAVAFGPVSLSESDTVNNLARQIVSQVLFADGFDGN